jgi:hypothetical protein
MNEEFLAGTGAGTAETGEPPYEPPRVLTFRGDEVLQLLGPAQACSFSGDVICKPGSGNPLAPTGTDGLKWLTGP